MAIWGDDYFVPTPGTGRLLSDTPAEDRKRIKTTPGSMMLFHPHSAPEEMVNLACTAANLSYLKIEKVVVNSSLGNQEIGRLLNKRQLGIVVIWVDDQRNCARIAKAAARKKMPVVLYCPTMRALKQLQLCDEGRGAVKGVFYDLEDLSPELHAKLVLAFPAVAEGHIAPAQLANLATSNIRRALPAITKWY